MARVLFLTASDPTKAAYWNKELPPALSTVGIDTTVAAWTSPENELIDLAVQHTHICLLTAANYNYHMPEFVYLLTEILPAIQKRAPQIKVLNSADLTLWNSAKTYLIDLQNAGFLIPRTMACPLDKLQGNLAVAIQEATGGSSGPVVIKPAIGASGLNVTKVKDASNVTAQEIAALQPILHSTTETVLLQEFLPDVQVNGELSLVYIGGQFVAAFRKGIDQTRPGEFRVNSEFGGTIAILADHEVPAAATQVSQEVLQWLKTQYGAESCAYMRLDGVMRVADGAFVLMEVECIEPSFLLPNADMLAKVVAAFAKLINDRP